MPKSRILVIDDDPKILSLMRRGLSFAGYAVDLAADGEEDLSTARDNQPDLVVLDVMLPRLDGLEVCRRLRAGDGSLPILMLTTKDRVPDRVAGLDAGADDYLVKPFAFDELLARIRALLRRAGSRGGAASHSYSEGRRLQSPGEVSRANSKSPRPAHPGAACTAVHTVPRGDYCRRQHISLDCH